MLHNFVNLVHSFLSALKFEACFLKINNKVTIVNDFDLAEKSFVAIMAFVILTGHLNF